MFVFEMTGRRSEAIMKRFHFLILLALLFSLLLFKVNADPQQFIGSLTTVNTTTNFTSTGISAFTFNPALLKGTVTHTQLTNLTSLSIDVFVNVQGATTNGMIKIGTWTPKNTNALTETVDLSGFAVTNYVFFAIGTTNNVGVGGTYGQ